MEYLLCVFWINTHLNTMISSWFQIGVRKNIVNIYSELRVLLLFAFLTFPV